MDIVFTGNKYDYFVAILQTLKLFFLNEHCINLIPVALTFVPNGLINEKPALIRIEPCGPFY